MTTGYSISYAGGRIRYSHGDKHIDFEPSCPAIYIDGEEFDDIMMTDPPAELGGQVVYGYMARRAGAELREISVTVRCCLSESDGAFRKYAILVPLFSGGIITRVTVERFKYVEPPVHRDFGESKSSYPYYFGDFFAALEFPYAATAVDGGVLSFGHMPMKEARCGVQYRTKSAVFGLADGMTPEQRFEEYITANRPATPRTQVNYNGWWTMPVRYGEDDTLALINEFKEKLYDRHGAMFDTFAIDMGWSAEDKVWELDENRYPRGLSGVKAAIESIGGRLGLWISPSNVYSPFSYDNLKAKEQGYEIIKRPGEPISTAACLAGEKYQSKLKSQLLAYVRRYGIMHVKFDGLIDACDNAYHGHPTGEGVRELIAEGLIDVFRALSEAQPGIWLEATCLGYSASPFWLNHCSSVLGTYGDDSPNGTLPAPNFRDSATSGRDYYNLQGCDRLSIPVKYQELLGVVHQSGEDFVNDAVVVLLRGNGFVPFYFNPRAGMDDARWAKLAALIGWFKAHGGEILETSAILPRSWERLPDDVMLPNASLPPEPYGYLHRVSGSHMALLRNPYHNRESIAFELSPESAGKAVFAFYPEERFYGVVDGRGRITIPLAPYETLAVKIVDAAADDQLVYVPPRALYVEGLRITDRGGARSAAFTVTSECAENELYILARCENAVALPVDLSAELDGAEVAFEPCAGDDGFTATVIPRKEFWRLAKIGFGSGAHEFKVRFTPPADAIIEVFALSFKRDGCGPLPSGLPQPERIYTDGVTVI